MSELSVQTKIQAVIQALDLFSDADVVINDWSILDRPSIEAPYVLIETADDFLSEQHTVVPESTWAIVVNLIERFTDWKETYDNFEARRQAIIDAFNGTGDARGASGLDIQTIRNDGRIVPYYDRSVPQELQAEALPVFIMQRLILETKEF